MLRQNCEVSQYLSIVSIAQLKVNFHNIFFCFNNMFFFLFYINYEWKLFLWHFYKTHMIQDIRYKIAPNTINTQSSCYFTKTIYYLFCHAILNHFLCHVEFISLCHTELVSSVMLNSFQYLTIKTISLNFCHTELVSWASAVKAASFPLSCWTCFSISS